MCAVLVVRMRMCNYEQDGVLFYLLYLYCLLRTKYFDKFYIECRVYTHKNTGFPREQEGFPQLDSYFALFISYQ